MTEQNEPVQPEQPDDDVEGHRFLTPDQAQERAEAAREERVRRAAEATGPADG